MISCIPYTHIHVHHIILRHQKLNDQFIFAQVFDICNTTDTYLYTYIMHL